MCVYSITVKILSPPSLPSPPPPLPSPPLPPLPSPPPPCSAGGSQEQLADAAIKAVKTISNEADHVKLGASSLGSEDMEAQLLLLTAVKDVANALGNLIGSTRSASGKSVQDPSMEKLKTSAKVMVAKVSSLLKTVKNVEDEAGRGVKSLEDTIDSINANLEEFNSANPPKVNATPEVLARSTKVGGWGRYVYSSLRIPQHSPVT